MHYLFTVAKYNDYRQKIFDDVISPRNKEYCDKHGYKYVVINNNHELSIIRNNPIWWKLFIIKELLESGKLEDGDEIVAFDADCYIVDIDNTFLTPTKSMSLSIDSGNSLCMGWYSFIINDWSRKFIKKLVDDDFYHRRKNIIKTHSRLKHNYSLWSIWAEQAAFYDLTGLPWHSDISFWDLKNYGWNTDITVDTIPVEELLNHIDVMPTEYNVSIWPEESDTTFYINKIYEKSKVKIRHLTGCDWNCVYNWV